jgi:hypothetical protein
MGSFTNRNRYPEPGHAGQRNRDADLRCKASFDRLEQRPAFPNVAVRPRERSATSVTKATPPIQWATNTTCKCAGYFDVVDH